VHVVERAEQLRRDLGGVLLGEALLLDDAVKQLAALDEVEHEVDVDRVLERLLHGHEAAVVEILHHENLALEQRQVVRVLADLFQRPNRTVRFAHHFVHGAAATLAQLLLLFVKVVRRTFLVVRLNVLFAMSIQATVAGASSGSISSADDLMQSALTFSAHFLCTAI
jgi:hypothetical protein